MNVEMQSLTDGQKKILIVLGLLIVLVVIHLFVVKPMKDQSAKVSAEAKQMNAEIDRRIGMVKKILPMKQEIAKLDAAICPITNQYVLYREFGNYPVQRKIYEYATNGLKIANFTELGRKRISDPVFDKVQGKSKGRSIKQARPEVCYDRFQVEVALNGSYFQILNFIRTIEQENPLFSVVSLHIIGGSSNPEVHDARMVLEWPVDAPPPSPKSDKKK